MDTNQLLTVWQRKVFDLLLEEGKIDQELVDQMRAWPNSGFSVDQSVDLPAGDTLGLQRLAETSVRCPFSLDRIIDYASSSSLRSGHLAQRLSAFCIARAATQL